MKINDPTAAGISSSRLGQTGATESVSRGRSGGNQASGISGDQVQLSDLASTVRVLASDSPERTQRIEQLAREVQSGRYQVDAKALSADIVDAALGGF